MYSGRRPEKELGRKHERDESKESAPVSPRKLDKIREADKEKDSSEGTPKANIKFSDMSTDDIAKQYSQRAPIEIPENVNVKAKSMADGYEQITYKWNDGIYKYEVRWQTKASEAPADQGNTWVI